MGARKRTKCAVDRGSGSPLRLLVRALCAMMSIIKGAIDTVELGSMRSLSVFGLISKTFTRLSSWKLKGGVFWFYGDFKKECHDLEMQTDFGDIEFGFKHQRQLNTFSSLSVKDLFPKWLMLEEKLLQ